MPGTIVAIKDTKLRFMVEEKRGRGTVTSTVQNVMSRAFSKHVGIVVAQIAGNRVFVERQIKKGGKPVFKNGKPVMDWFETSKNGLLAIANQGVPGKDAPPTITDYVPYQLIPETHIKFFKPAKANGKAACPTPDSQSPLPEFFPPAKAAKK